MFIGDVLPSPTDISGIISILILSVSSKLWLVETATVDLILFTSAVICVWFVFKLYWSSLLPLLMKNNPFVVEVNPTDVVIPIKSFDLLIMKTSWVLPLAGKLNTALSEATPTWITLEALSFDNVTFWFVLNGWLGI